MNSLQGCWKGKHSNSELCLSWEVPRSRTNQISLKWTAGQSQRLHFGFIFGLSVYLCDWRTTMAFTISTFIQQKLCEFSFKIMSCSIVTIKEVIVQLSTWVFFILIWQYRKAVTEGFNSQMWVCINIWVLPNWVGCWYCVM